MKIKGYVPENVDDPGSAGPMEVLVPPKAANRESDGSALNVAHATIEPIDSAPWHLYCQPVWDGASVVSGGSDRWSDYLLENIHDDPTRALASFIGVEKVLKSASGGRQVVVQFIADAPGGDIEKATGTRQVTTRRILLQGGEGARVPVSYRGPREMCPVQGGSGPLTGLTFLGGAGGNDVDTRAIFAGGTFPANVRGWFRQQQNDGRDTYFPIPIRRNTDTTLWLDALLSGADLNGDIGVNNPNCSVVTPAILIVADDFKSEVLIEGRSAGLVGDRSFNRNTNFDNPQNVLPSFAYLHMVHSRWLIEGHCLLVHLLLDDFPHFQKGMFTFRSCMYDIACEMSGMEGGIPAAMDSFIPTITPCGWPKVFAQPLPVNADPIVPYNGCALLGHGALIVGSSFTGGMSARPRFNHALSVAPHPTLGAGTGGIVVNNPGSQLYIGDNGALYCETDGSVPGIRCKERSKARGPFASTSRSVFNCANKDLDVGRNIGVTPAISQAVFALGTKILQNALPDDDSLIIDSTVEDADTAYNDGR